MLLLLLLLLLVLLLLFCFLLGLGSQSAWKGRRWTPWQWSVCWPGDSEIYIYICMRILGYYIYMYINRPTYIICEYIYMYMCMRMCMCSFGYRYYHYIVHCFVVVMFINIQPAAWVKISPQVCEGQQPRWKQIPLQRLPWTGVSNEAFNDAQPQPRFQRHCFPPGWCCHMSLLVKTNSPNSRRPDLAMLRSSSAQDYIRLMQG